MDIDRARVIADLKAEGLSVTEWRDEPNTSYPVHTHPHREVRVVLAGTMTVVAQGVTHMLGPGDRIDLPAEQTHSATVGPGGVHYLAASAKEPPLAR
jgi:quercetin dioxygenase-like cupin family protein